MHSGGCPYAPVDTGRSKAVILVQFVLNVIWSRCFMSYFVLQLDHSNVAYVMDSVFINIQLTINYCLSKGFPDQINESFMRMYHYDLNIVLLVRIAQSVEPLTNC